MKIPHTVGDGPTDTKNGSGEEVLHSTESVRIIRQWHAEHGPIIAKRATGNLAGRRLAHEIAVLQRLAGVAGVRKPLVDGTPNALLLPDDGSIALDKFLCSCQLDVEQAVNFAHAVARILAEVHRAGVIHRDICPASLLIHPQTYQPTLIGLSTAAFIGELGANTAGGAEILCTWAYMSPEQTGRIGRTPDQRSDLYSLGVTLYELLTQRRPFEAEDLLELVHDHLVRVPAAPASVNRAVPAILSDLVMRLLEKEPDRRYQSADGLAQDLERIHAALLSDTVPSFELGQFDFGARLNPPPQLIGRDLDIAAVREFLAQALAGGPRCLLISGPPGAGKSALLDQLRPLVAMHRGWFMFRKFDQYRQDSRSSALQAFRSLAQQLLAEPEESLAYYRERMIQALGSNVGMAASMSPEFELLLGRHPTVELSDPQEAEARTVQAALDLFRSLASPDRPLVYVCDDLHWAPGTARRLLDAVVASPEPIAGLLLVGAYRDSAVPMDHPLHQLIERWKNLDRAPCELMLDNLTPAAASTLIGAMLRLPQDEAANLATVLAERTQHNVYNTIELLNALRHDGLLVPSNGRWRWDATAIHRHIGNTSIADLSSRRIGKLPSESRDVLQVLACLGGEASLYALEQATELDAIVLQRRLEPAANDGLLASVAGERPVWRFVNDRVQQAVLEGMPLDARTLLHLQLARRLAVHCAKHSEVELLAAEQYLAARTHLSDQQEQRFALQLFERVAQRLRLLNGAAAERYVAAAIEHLERIATPQDGPQLYALRAEHHRVLFSLGRLDESAALYPWLAEHAPNPIVLSQSTRIQMHLCGNRRQFGEALTLGLTLLGQMGMVKPPDVRGDMAAGFRRLTEWSRSAQMPEDLTRAEASDERVLAWSMILPLIGNSAYFCDPLTWAWSAWKSLSLWIEHGPSHRLLAGFVGVPALLVSSQDFRGAQALGRHMLNVGEKRGYEPSTSFARTMFALTAAHWVEPIENAAAEFFRARNDLMRRGDEAFFAVTFVAVDHVFDYATTLDTVCAESDLGLAVAARSNNVDFRLRFLPRKQMLLALRGETDAPGAFETTAFNEADYQQSIDPSGPTAATYHTMRALTALFFGDIPTLTTHAAKALALGARIPGYYILAIGRVMQAIALGERARALPTAERTAVIEELDNTCLKWLAARAADAPVNFQHLLRWVEAERAWASESLWTAGAAFDAAVQEATLHARPWHRALINERAAQFHLLHGLEQSARLLLVQACEIYEAWGAVGKVKELRRLHPFLRSASTQLLSVGQQSTSSVGHQVIDMMAVLRASQALSSQTSLGSLTRQVSKLLSALTGATSVQLIVRPDVGNAWVLANSLGSEREPVTVEQAALQGLLPLSAFRYVERTAELLVIDDVARDERCSAASYLRRFDQGSLLVSPILKQGQLSAVLVLENSQRRGAFSADRLESVAMIAGQLAVSLDNALLYASLERRVAERTAELQRKTDDINAMLQHMPQGVLTILANGTVHPEYSAYLATILEDGDIAERNVMTLLFAGSSLDANALDQIEAAIGACIGEDSMNFEFNSHLLATEFDKTLRSGRVKSLALSWSAICDESGTVQRLMVCVRDVTELKRLASEAGARKRELQIIAEILGVAQEKLYPFIHGARDFLDENRRLLELGDLHEETTQQLFRNMHTLKGNARTYGLATLTQLVHVAEQSYANLRGAPPQGWNRAQLLTELTAVRELLETYAHVNSAVLGRKGPGRRSDGEKFLMVERSTVQGTLRSLLSVDRHDERALRTALHRAAHMLDTIGTESLTQLLARELESLPALALELGKQAPTVEISDHGIAIRQQASSVLRNVFTHLLRNSLDHGIELPSRRIEAGKPAAGRITLQVAADDCALSIRLRDDGRGLALKQIQQRAIEQGVLAPEQPLSAAQVAQLVFCPGLSTAT